MGTEVLYTFDSALEELIYRMQNRQDIESRARGWLNSAQLQFAKSDIELPEIETTIAVTLTQNKQEYSFVLDFVDSSGQALFWPFIGVRSIKNLKSGWRLRRWPWRDYRRMIQQPLSAPVRYARHGQLIAFDPIPDDQGPYDMLFDYRRLPEPDLLEIDSSWHEHLIQYGLYLGWMALDEQAKAMTAYRMLPMYLQERLQMPLTQAEWEAQWDEDVGFVIDKHNVGGY